MTKINFVNLPNTTTPLNATNMNAIQTNAENAINSIDTLNINGTVIPQNSDLNNYTTPGVFYSQTGTISATLSNTPVTNAAFKMIVEYLHNTSRIRQTIYVNNTTSDTYVRTFSSSQSWGEWMKMATGNDTGEIILSNALNIRYRKVGNQVSLNINYRGDQAQTSKQLTAYAVTELATLPTGYRPSTEIDAPLFVRLDNGATTDCYLIIYTNGKIDVFNWGTAKTAVGIIGNVSFFVS